MSVTRINVFPKLEYWPSDLAYRGVSYCVDVALSDRQCQQAIALLGDTATEHCFVGKVPAELRDLGSKRLVDVSYLPGVTDNRARTAKEVLVHGGVIDDGDKVYAGTVHALDASGDAEGLHNPLIERAEPIPQSVFKAEALPPFGTEVRIASSSQADLVDLSVNADALLKISAEGVVGDDGIGRGPLGLSLEDMHAIRQHFEALGRKPTDAEIETLAQSWSEHCKHRIFAGAIDDIEEGVFKRYIAAATHEIMARPDKKNFCLSVFTDNAGAIVFDDDWMVCDKVETHNSPSALDPYGGAMTGIVGVNRDCLGFGLGAKPIANRYGFCFGPPQHDQPLFRDPNQRSALPSVDTIANGVIEGIEAGGNQSGIPTPQGFVLHDERYSAKPLVFCGTVGLLPRTLADGRAGEQKQARAGDRIVVAGGRVGRDGIHGATFSSVALDENSPATAVQIGDPITQKRLSDCMIRSLRDSGLYSAVTDNGAGGLSSSIGEMARDCGGAKVALDRVPLKYPGLAPWEIWISESQERMSFAVPPENVEAVVQCFADYGVEAVDIGCFTSEEQLVLSYEERVIADLSMAFLHEGAPRKILTSRKPQTIVSTSDQIDFDDAVKQLQSSPSLRSRDDLALLFDHEVQAASVIKPLQGPGNIQGDATVIAPVASSVRAVGLSQAVYPWMTERDAHASASLAIDNAVRNLVAAGCDPHQIALQDNFCWCSAEDPERLFQLKEACRGAYEAAIHFGAPFISGKDSMFNDFRGFDAAGNPTAISALPTLLISSIGILNNWQTAQSMDFKAEGDAIILVGKPTAQLGGGALEAQLSDTFEVPETTLTALETLEAVAQCLAEGLIASSKAIGMGGVMRSLLASARSGELGVRIDTDAFDDDTQWFSEFGGQFLLSVAEDNAQLVADRFRDASIIGHVTKETTVRIKRASGGFSEIAS